MITMIKIVILFCFLIIPLRGPTKRRENNHQRPDKTVTCSNYGINEHGELEELLSDNKDSKHDSL
jgi:hypothetical protein